jgi:hypothetical protein
MRAVFCRTLRQKIALLAAPSLPVSAMALQSRLEYRSSYYAGPRRPEDPNPVSHSSNRLITHPCQAGRTSRRGPGIVTPDHPPAPHSGYPDGMTRRHLSASLYGRAACSGRPSGPCVLEVADSTCAFTIAGSPVVDWRAATHNVIVPREAISSVQRRKSVGRSP